MSSSVNALRIVTFIFNFVFWLSGVAIFGIGLWLLFDPAASDFFSLHSAHSGSFQYVGWFLVGAGALIILIGYFGCFGALRMNQCALAVFCCILIIAFFLELTAAVIAYNKQDHVKMYVESSMYDTIKNRYSSESAFREAFDSIQTSFQCCGVKSYTDWLGTDWHSKTNFNLEAEKQTQATGKVEYGIGAYGSEQENGIGKVPGSCCNEHGRQTYPGNCGKSFDQAPLFTYAQFIHEKGCSDALFERVTNLLDLIVTICIIFCLSQLVGIVLSMTLCCCANKSKSIS